MKNDSLLKYRMLNAEEVNREVFKDFIRYQNVTKCWRKENGKWIIKDAPFIDDWTERDYQKTSFLPEKYNCFQRICLCRFL